MVKIKTTKEFHEKEFLDFMAKRDDVLVGIASATEGFGDDCPDCLTLEVDFISNYDIETDLITGVMKVTFEEKVTDETVIPMIIEVSTNEQETNTYVDVFVNKSINSIKKEYGVTDTLAFHMVNSDGTTTLLWTKEGGMVE